MPLLSGIRSIRRFPSCTSLSIMTQVRTQFTKRGMPQIFHRDKIESEEPLELVRQHISGIYEEDGNVFKRPGCQLCWQSLDEFNYKDVLLISQFISPIGRLYDRHETGICKKMQVKLRVEIKKARNIGLIPKAMTPQQVQKLKEEQEFVF